jgi:copper chaperone CopZ
MKRVTLPIEGLLCGGGGALAVERAIERVPGVIRVYVNPATEMAYAEYDPAQCSPAELNAAVQRAGFRVGTLARF